MTPQEFVKEWASTPLGEKQSYQSHFNDLCDMLGQAKPDATGRAENGQPFQFEWSLKKTSGGQGFADVFYGGRFAIEYKSPGKYRDFGDAYNQLLQYRENLNNPPLLIVTDIKNWEIYTNFPNTAKCVYRIAHNEIASDPEKLAWLRNMFDDPDRLNPGRNTEEVTADAAKSFQVITDNMRDWNTDPTRIAFFATKLVFCLFAEDIGLLPRIRNTPTGIFTDVIKQSQGKPKVFKRHLQNLFNEMNRGGEYFGEDIKYFNGTLFSVVTVEELSLEAIDALAEAAALNWESIEPSIFGTLFERSLDPAKRSQLGAHYTSREDILLIIEPVLMKPLRYEWDTVQLEAAPARERFDNPQDRRERVNAGNRLTQLRERILKRLRETTVLDPACGSGNFLYVALQELMELEKEVINHELWDGLQMPLPAVHPRQMFGIEIAPIAHALASIVVWIGYIQWRIKNGYGRTFSEPILEKLQGNIVCKDAILPLKHPHPPAPSPKMREGEKSPVKWDIPPELERRMQAVARELRKNPTVAENTLWQAIRKRQLDDRKFRRQVAIGAFVVDFYCSTERLVVEVDGPIHEEQTEADRLRQELIESLGIRFVRLTNHEVEYELQEALARIRQAYSKDELAQGDESPLPLYGGGGLGVGVDWPAVDVIVGNPPFLGGGKMRGELGDKYYERLTDYYQGRLPGFADLVCYWFENAREQIENGKAKRAGLLATNSIRGGANREVLKRIKETGDIFMAWSDREWILDGAAVRVSMVGYDKGVENERVLDGIPSQQITADLKANVEITLARRLSENELLSFQGPSPKGSFDINGDVARSMLKKENTSGRENSDVVKPVVNAADIVKIPRHFWTIDFGPYMPEYEAQLYELPYEHVLQHVYPVRKSNNREAYRRKWWIYAEARVAMRERLSKLNRYIATPRVAKHRVFVWINAKVMSNDAIIAIARDDDYFFGVLHSKLHEFWSLRMGTSLEDRPRYTPTTTFETFPFPWPPGAEDKSHPAHTAISSAAKQLHEERDAWLNPHLAKDGCRGDLVGRPPAVDAPPPNALGGPRGVKDRTLTNLYNALNVFRGRDSMKTKPAASDFAPRLDALHRALDEAVCDAYGWGYAVLDDEEEILRRLLALNLGRAS